MTTNGNGWKTAALSALGALLLLALTLGLQEISADRRAIVRLVHDHTKQITALEERVKQLEAKR